MQEFGGFEIEFISKVNMKYVKNLAEEAVAGIAESWEQIYINDSANKIYIPDDSYIDFNEFDGLFEKICKTIVRSLPEASFDGISHYSNCSTDYDVYNIITYKCHKKEFVIKNIFGEGLDGYCTNCGERLFDPRKGIISNVYYCKNCKEDIKFDINCDEHILSLKSDQ